MATGRQKEKQENSIKCKTNYQRDMRNWVYPDQL